VTVSVRVAAAGDIHVGCDTEGRIAAALAGIESCADVLLLAGDLTQVGSDDEARCVVAELADVPIPIIAVLGNHDHHAGEPARVAQCLADAGIEVLDGTATTIDLNGLELGIAGIKGFGGGFLGRAASDFGEPEMRAFALHSIDTAARLERCLEDLDGDVRVVLLHYSPVPDTLVGEPLELFPFLGSYLLAEAIDRTLPDLVIHGHAHRGTERGVTPGGVRVRNVALPVLGAPFRVYELSAETRHPPS
jgi:Icc-related predicted phosphoesterase